MNTPRATARLQLHAGYTLSDACAHVDYYADLGISHLYLSPITQARAGSTHGYDVIDHGVINPELGGESALLDLARAARGRGLGLIADIVPNHMAAHPSNPWWRSVLAEGSASAYARHFDIDWHSPDPALRGKVLLPVLPEPYGVTLDQGGITLRHDPQTEGYTLDVGGLILPLAAGALPGDPATVLRHHDPADTEGRRRLHRLLERQHYRLAWWRTAPDQINWRRFFEISELVGVRVEDPHVFDAVHALALRLYAQGILDGLRIDHVDGLAAPGAYLRQLRQALAQAGMHRPTGHTQDRPYLVVEKILASGETLDARWDTNGTTGYDFMDQVGAVLHAPGAEAPLRAFWQHLTADRRSPAEQLEAARARMLTRHFAAARRALVRCLARIARQDPHTRDWSAAAVDRVLSAWLTAFPVYRTYAEDGGRSAADSAWCQRAAQRARGLLDARPHSADAALLSQIDQWLDGHDMPPNDAATSVDKASRARHSARTEALRRFQQLTPPLAAKALEDTLFYRYGPLLSRNEVGAAPDCYALAPAEFLTLCDARARTLPHAMLATATHDHKRGEDTRARLAVLSEMPAPWTEQAQRWLDTLPSSVAPTPADRYLLIQTLVGAWPADWDATMVDQDPERVAGWLERVAQWQSKALREAKLHTSWTDPDADYEQAAQGIITWLLEDAPGRSWLRGVAAFAQTVAPAGMINSLSQTLLRNTLPGVPDLYQGTDLWDFSLVDPDNRRPVDYAAREALLSRATQAVSIDLSEASWRSGAVKQALIHRLLTTRRHLPALFADGACLPVPVLGPQADHVIACLRRVDGQQALIVAARTCALAVSGYATGQAEAAREFWDGTALHMAALPTGSTLHDAMDGRRIGLGADGVLPVATLLRDWPVALCVSVSP